MLEKALGAISLILLLLIYGDFKITTKIGKFKFFLFEIFTFVKAKILNSVKNKIILIYYIYCIIINYIYQNRLISVISKQKISYDKINMIIFYILVISATFLEKNNNKFNNNSKGFFDNIAFCFINLIWLLYMLCKIIIFLLLETIHIAIEELKNLGIKFLFFTCFGSLFGYTLLGSTLLTSIFGGFLTTTFGMGYKAYQTDEKLGKVLNSVLNDLKTKKLDFLFKYVFIFVINIIFLFMAIIINIVLKLKSNFDDFILYDKEVIEEKNRLIRNARNS